MTGAADPDRPWLAGLNPEQRAAVTFEGGPLLVVAGAGSGKTRTLATRVAWLIDRGVPAERILLLTFTRRAAAEMVGRAANLLADRSVGRVWGGTFHSVANRLLRRYGTAVGVDPSFTVLDQGDAADLFGQVRADLGFASRETRFPKKETIAAVYSRMVNAQVPLDRVLDERYPWCREHGDDLRAIFREYTATKRGQQVLDYDDLLLYWRALLQSPAGSTVASLFDHVLVDEYQDTNAVQADILEALTLPAGHVTVVGDDAQAIYSFRAASVDNMLRFPQRFPGTTVLTLEQNYRSTPPILDAANAVIGAATEGYAKQLWSSRPAGPVPALVTCFDEPAQSAVVCERILELREEGIALKDQAVLFRTGHHSDGLEVELARRDIPYVKFGGLRFLEAAHVKDLLALLRILDNPRDDLAWRRILETLPGVGPVTAGRLLEVLSLEGPGERLACLLAACPPLPADAADDAAELRAALAECSGDGTTQPPVASQIERLLSFCRSVLERRYDDVAARMADLETLASLASDYTERSRFLTELILDPPTSTGDLAGPPHLDDDYLILSTIHSAKGGEWRAVYVIHAADGNIPSDMSLGEPGGVEEERRLLYVALTRARDHLTVTVPQRFYHRRFSADPAHNYAPPSRFLAPAAECFASSAAGGYLGYDDPDALLRPGVDPVVGILEALWS